MHKKIVLSRWAHRSKNQVGINTHPNSAATATEASDSSTAGFSLVEVLVAMTIFACVAAALTNLILRSIDESQNNKARVIATNLASRQLELLREFDQSQLVSTGNQRLNDIVINKITYQVNMATRWLPAATVKDQDSGGYNVGKCNYKLSSSRPQAYVRADVSVRWTGISQGQVSSSTLIRPDKLENVDGAELVVIDVSRANGSTPPSMVVKITNGSTSVKRQTATDTNGCAEFAFLPADMYTITVGDASQGEKVVTQTANVKGSTYGSIVPVTY